LGAENFYKYRARVSGDFITTVPAGPKEDVNPNFGQAHALRPTKMGVSHQLGNTNW
jgi:hypothetical protein